MGKQILVIDDDDAIRELFTAILQDAGYDVSTAETGEKGLEKTRQEKYDLIFLDLKMPGIDGLETLQNIRSEDKKIPIYMMTSFYSEYFDELMRVRENQFQFELLKKPIDPKTIVTLTNNVLRKGSP